MINQKEGKTELIRIRCYPSTKRDFRIFVAEGNFRTMEEALKALLECYAQKPKGGRLLR